MSRETPVPEDFLCPITLEIMKDPVIASDEQTCERLDTLLLMFTAPVVTLGQAPQQAFLPNADATLQMLQMSARHCFCGCNSKTQAQSHASPSSLISEGTVHCSMSSGAGSRYARALP